MATLFIQLNMMRAADVSLSSITFFIPGDSLSRVPLEKVRSVHQHSFDRGIGAHPVGV